MLCLAPVFPVRKRLVVLRKPATNAERDPARSFGDGETCSRHGHASLPPHAEKDEMTDECDDDSRLINLLYWSPIAFCTT